MISALNFFFLTFSGVIIQVFCNHGVTIWKSIWITTIQAMCFGFSRRVLTSRAVLIANILSCY